MKLVEFISVGIISALLLFSLTSCGKEKTVEETKATETQDDMILADVETYAASNDANSVFKNSFVNDAEIEGIVRYEPVQPNTIDFNMDEFKVNVADNIEEVEVYKIEDMDQAEIDLIVETKYALLNELVVAFESVDLNVFIDETSGEVSLDSSVLFGGDSAVLSDEGKTLLKKFIKAYSSVVLSEKYDDFISKILVEGHTAPVAGSTYESGLPLSEERANNVKDYCLSAETGITDSEIDSLKSTMEAIGLSNSKPIKDSNGDVDMDASRRVTFRFLINLD